MTTPQEFAIKTDSSWVYPKEMYVYDGSNDKVVEEVYVWTGSEAVLVWPVPSYEPGLTNKINGDYWPLPSVATDYTHFVPLYFSDYDTDKLHTPGTLRSLTDAQMGQGAQFAPDARTGSSSWDVSGYGDNAGVGHVSALTITSDFFQFTPYQQDDLGGVFSNTDDITYFPCMNMPDVGLGGAVAEWRLDISEAGAAYTPWDYNAQGSTPLYMPRFQSFDGWAKEANGFLDPPRRRGSCAGGPDYTNALGLSNFRFWLDPETLAGYPTVDEFDCTIDHADILLELDCHSYSETGQTQAGNNGYMDYLQNGSFDIETFPQGLSSSAWDPDVLWTPSIANWNSIEPALNEVNQENFFGADTQISHIRWKTMSGDWKKLRFDNLWGGCNPNQTSGARFMWGSTVNDYGCAHGGGIMMRTLPWNNYTGAPFGNEEWTIFDPEYSKFLAYMSEPARSQEDAAYIQYTGYDYIKDNFRRADFFTSADHFTGDNKLSRMQGMLTLPGEIEIVHRKPFTEARLLWQEIGVVVGARNGLNIMEPQADFNCTPGTITSFLPSGNTSLVRYRQSKLPRYYRDGCQTFQMDDYNCTNGDFKNYDGDFQEDFFDRSDYVELRIYNQTTGKWMRSLAWGENTRDLNDASSMIPSTSAAYYPNADPTLSFSRFRPIFLMNPKEIAVPNAVNRWLDFYTEGDIIDFKLYSR